LLVGCDGDISQLQVLNGQLLFAKDN